MHLIYLLFLPAIIILFAFILQKFYDKDQFYEFFKMTLIGLATGFILLLLSHLTSQWTEFKAHHQTILIQSLLLKGIIMTGVIGLVLFFSLEIFIGMKIDFSWANLAIVGLGYILGIHTVLNFYDTSTGFVPSGIFQYIGYASYLLLFILILSYTISKFHDAFELYQKILLIAGGFIVLAVLSTFFYFVKFYQYYEAVFLLIPAAALTVFFEIFEFRHIR